MADPVTTATTEEKTSLLEELEGVRGDFTRARQWLVRPQTTERMSAWLENRGADETAARKCLAVLYMCVSSGMLSPGVPEDDIMGRESMRFQDMFARGTASAEDVVRLVRFYDAWAAQDRPKTLRWLMDSVTTLRARGEDPDETFDAIRRLGGVERETAARRMYGRDWSFLPADDLEAHVRNLVRRAFWDAIREEAEHDHFDRLWETLGELRAAMDALVSHSATAKAELDDKFDVAWLRDMAGAGALPASSVRGLMHFLSRTITSWQAPADDASGNAWVKEVDALCAGDEALGPLVAGPFLEFLDGAFERLAGIYARIFELRGDTEPDGGPDSESSGETKSST